MSPVVERTSAFTAAVCRRVAIPAKAGRETNSRVSCCPFSPNPTSGSRRWVEWRESSCIDVRVWRAVEVSPVPLTALQDAHYGEEHLLLLLLLPRCSHQVLATSLCVGFHLDLPHFGQTGAALGSPIFPLVMHARLDTASCTTAWSGLDL